MNLILLCVFITFSVGLFLLLAGLLRLPTLKTSRIMMDTGKEGKLFLSRRSPAARLRMREKYRKTVRSRRAVWF